MVGWFWIILFRFGELYEYKEEGIEPSGDVDKGECGIIIRNIDYKNSGTWKCEVLRKQRPVRFYDSL